MALKPATEAVDTFGLTALPESYACTTNSQTLDHGTYFSRSISVLNWYFVAYSSNSTIFSTFSDTFLLVASFFIIFFLLTILMLYPVLAHIISPLHALHKVMQTVSESNIDVHSDVCTNDEIGDLSQVFNQMIENIHTHIRLKIQYEKKQNQIYYNLLIAQIDSHFICNTMSIINSMARRGKMHDIIKANTALIKIIQNCLRVKTYKITDTLEQEIDVVQQYMIIEKMRYKNEAALFITTMIVEDETYILEDLLTLIDWEAAGFKIASTAINGEQGLNQYEKYHPQLVLTDIKMPVMDGLDMMKSIKQMNPSVNFIIISSYSDFEYAQLAMRLGASDYILKGSICKEYIEKKLISIKTLYQNNNELNLSLFCKLLNDLLGSREAISMNDMDSLFSRMSGIEISQNFDE